MNIKGLFCAGSGHRISKPVCSLVKYLKVHYSCPENGLADFEL